METYFLDGIEVVAPQGVDGLTLKKERNRRYFSMLYKGIGYGQGVGNVTFTDARSKDMLMAIYRQHGIMASMTFTLEQYGETVYSAFVDFSTISYGSDGISVGFIDPPARQTLEAGLSMKRGVLPGMSIQLSARSLTGPATHLINNALKTIQMAQGSTFSVFQAVPLSAPEGNSTQNKTGPEGSLLSVSNPQLIPVPAIYRNTTSQDQTLRVSGVIRVTTRSQTPLALSWIVRTTNPDGGTLKNTLQAETGLVDSLIAVTVAIDTITTVPPGGSICLLVAGNAQTNRLTLDYDTVVSRITLQATSATSEAQTTVWGCFVPDLLTKLLQNPHNSEGSNSFYSGYLTTGPAKNLFITTGKHLSGRAGKSDLMTSSVQEVFEGLKSIYNLSLWTEETNQQVVIEDTISYLRTAPRTYLSEEQIVKLSTKPFLDFQYGEVMGGYSTWKATGAGLVDDEVMSPRSYSTANTRLRNSLDITCKTLVASSTLREQVRRGEDKGSSGGSSNTANIDNLLFVIEVIQDDTGQWVTAGREKLKSLSGVIDSTGADNWNLSPARCLARWSGLFPLPDLVFVSGEGNTLASSMIVGESSAVNEQDTQAANVSFAPVFLGEQVSLTGRMSMLDYKNLGDWLDYADPETGVDKTGLIMEALWRQTDKEGDICALVLLT